jgi:hypothetical protein
MTFSSKIWNVQSLEKNRLIKLKRQSRVRLIISEYIIDKGVMNKLYWKNYLLRKLKVNVKDFKMKNH